MSGFAVVHGLVAGYQWIFSDGPRSSERSFPAYGVRQSGQNDDENGVGTTPWSWVAGFQSLPAYSGAIPSSSHHKVCHTPGVLD